MPKKGKTTVRSGFLPFLWNLSHLSTARGSPPRINARGLTLTKTLRQFPRQAAPAGITAVRAEGACVFDFSTYSPRR